MRQTVFVFGFSGVGLNAGAYGGILAGCECTCGRYPVTLSFLKLVSNMVQVCLIFFVIFRCTYFIKIIIIGKIFYFIKIFYSQ